MSAVGVSPFIMRGLTQLHGESHLCQATDHPATGDHPISHLQTTGFCMHAALMSGSAPEQGSPFSCTQPGAMGGHGVPSGLTHACSGLA
jgi:hypothetical protein